MGTAHDTCLSMAGIVLVLAQKENVIVVVPETFGAAQSLLNLAAYAGKRGPLTVIVKRQANAPVFHILKN